MAEAAQADTPTDAAWNVPESLAGLVEAQAARLLPEQRDLLEAACVCGVEFRVKTLPLEPPNENSGLRPVE